MGNDFKIVFVGGSPRSGTTLVQKLLVGHEEIAGGCEFMVLPKMLDLFELMMSDYHLNRQDIYWTENSLKNSFRKFILSFFETLGSSSDKIKIVCEKSPVNIFVADKLLKLFDDSAFIVIHRDGRDVVASMLDVNERVQNSRKGKMPVVKNAAKMWNRAIFCENKLFKGPFAQRVHSLKYESLTSDAENQTKELMRFLQLPFEDSQLQTQNIDRSSLGNTETNDPFYTEEMYKQKISASKVGSWRKRIPRLYQPIVQILLAQNLNSMGYDIPSHYLYMAKALRRLR